MEQIFYALIEKEHEMPPKKKDGVMKINGKGIKLDGQEIPNVLAADISIRPDQAVEVDLKILVTEIEIEGEHLVKIADVEIPQTMTDTFEKAIIEKLAESNLIDPERL